MVKHMPNLFVVVCLILSWTIGLLFINQYYNPVVIIPTFNDYLWFDRFEGVLGLTLIVTVITMLLFFLQFKFSFLTSTKLKKIVTYSSHYVLWIAVLAIQLKVIAFNLGICH
ncbi:hypothetical protein [Radiobacillus sp. PE A8.2]|uniref:hypothetical protein n=1 Tax=Radiobacillus sp. PE A8.2 TaxID=3380349 RepID=UPI00388E86CD